MTPARTTRGGLALIGSRGTGKTTVGKLVADRLGLPFVDADEAIGARLGQSIRSFFDEYGEAEFRNRECALLAELVAGPPRVIATGGGAVLRPENRESLRAFGLVVWLTAPPDLLADRLAADPASGSARPALTAAGTLAEVADVLRRRTPLYRATADVEVSTEGRSPAEVADAVLAARGFD